MTAAKTHPLLLPCQACRRDSRAPHFSQPAGPQPSDPGTTLPPATCQHPPLAGIQCSPAPGVHQPWGQARGLEKHSPVTGRPPLRTRGHRPDCHWGPRTLPPRGGVLHHRCQSLRKVGAAQTGTRVSVTRGLRAAPEGRWMVSSVGKTNAAFDVPLAVTVTRRTAKPCDLGARARQPTPRSTRTSRRGLHCPPATASHAGPWGRRHAV